MFEIHKILKYLTFISYVGFMISCISGFVEISKSFNLCEFMISLSLLPNLGVLMYFEVSNAIDDYIQDLNYFRAYIQIMVSMLILGISPVGTGFGVYGIILGFVNLFTAILCLDNGSPQTSTQATTETP